RASLGERLRAARDSFASLRLKLADAPALTLTQKIASKLTGLSGAVDATRLVETTNEFRLLREEARRSDADDAPSRLFWEAVASERAAYNLFCDAALKSNDLNVARSLLESAQDLEKTVSGLPQPSVPQSLDAQTFASQAVDVAGFNARLNRGFFRNFVQRCAVVGCVFALIAVLGFGYSASKANERAATAQKSEAEANAKAARAGQEKALAQLETAEANKEKALVEANAKAERKAAQVREIEQAVAPLVVENWSQGEVALRGYITDPELTATAQHIAERSGIFLEAVSPRRVIVDAIAFSADEKYFAVLSNGKALVYNNNEVKNQQSSTQAQINGINSSVGNSVNNSSAELKVEVFSPLFTSVAQFPVDKYDGARYLCGNPAFVDAASDKIEENSQFLLCRDDGVVAFLSFDANGATSTREIDFRVSEPQKGRVAWGRPTLATDDSGQTRLFVADAAGQGSIYSLPEGRLLKRFAICEPVDDFIPLLIATPDGRALFTAGLDGSFKRWSGDGEELETLTLPLSGEADFSFGGFARKIDVSPDGKTFYATDESGEFVVWDVAGKKAIYVGQEPVNPAQGERCGISPTANFILRVYHIDADRFLTIGFNDRWRVWDLANRDPNGVPANFELRADDAEPSYGLRSCNISPSRRRFAIYLNSHQFELYDIKERRALVRSEGLLHNGMYTLASAAYLPQSDRILVGTHGFHSLASYSPQTLRAETQYVPYPDAKMNFMVGLNMFASSLAVPDVGDEFAASFCSGDVFFFKDGAAEPTGKLENPFETDTNVSWLEKIANLPLLAASPNGSRLVGKMANGDEFILWDWKTRAELKRWPAQKSESNAKNFLTVATSDLEFINETELLEIQTDGSVVCYNVETGERVATIPTPRFDLNNVSALNLDKSFSDVVHSLSNDRRRLALGFDNGLVAVVDLATKRPVFFDPTLWKSLPKRPKIDDSPNTLGYDLSRSVGGFAWSRDDSLLCATFLNGQAILLETRD
ncbi:MAG: WD40 repeat domain-containing protein, partial [Thermoguttaceae bacterium]|nr:WD40 repeat domain-containing protein [Thermoguttaceae bacterium]